MQRDAIEIALEDFGRRVKQQAKANLTKQKKNDTGALYNDLDYDVSVHQRSFHFSFSMPDYAMFQDQGVKGVKSSARAPKSPFKFGTGSGKKGGLTKSIEGWVKRKRFQFRKYGTGRFMSYEETARAITRSIYNKGIKSSHFFTKPFENEFKKLPDELVQAYGLEIETFMKITLKA